MRTTYRMLAAGALSLPLALGISGTAMASTATQSQVSEDPAAASVQFQNQDDGTNEQRSVGGDARASEDDGLNLDLTSDGLLGSGDNEDSLLSLGDNEGRDQDGQDDGLLDDILGGNEGDDHDGEKNDGEKNDGEDDGLLGDILGGNEGDDNEGENNSIL